MKMCDLVPNTDNVLCNFPPCLRKNIEELCLRSRIGLSDVTLSDISFVPNKVQDAEDIFNNYHFIITIRYGGKQLKWEVIFDPEDFYFTPDFDFNDEEFLNSPDYEVIRDNVPALKNWNLKNPKGLSQVLNEFLRLYKKTHVERLQLDNIYSRYCEEYEALITEETGVEADNVEIVVEPNSIIFLISLKIDCSSLPEYIQPNNGDGTWYNPGNDFALLKVSILKLDGTRSSVTMQLSPRLEQVLGNSRNLHMPDYKRELPLVEYVSQVSRLIENRIAFIAEHFKMKKIYIATIAAICNKTMVEYDTESFNKAVFLHCLNKYTCLVTIILGNKFPQEKPTVILSSIYCQEGKACSEILDRYSYSMDLDIEENINHLLDALDEAVFRFKNHRHR